MRDDDLRPPGKANHVGLALWAAARAWRDRLTAEMAAQGVDWYGQGRAGLIPHIGAKGVRMADLPARSGLTRQAVHQFVAALESEGVLRREPDPDDARGRVVRFTAAGLDVLRAADDAKRRIEEDYAARLGVDRFETFLHALAVLTRASEPGVAPQPSLPPRRKRRRSGAGSSR